MATSTIVQYLGNKQQDVSGATAYVGTSASDRTQVETFLTETAITAGQLIAVDIAKMVTDGTGGFTALTAITADYNSAPVQKIVVGVALESVTGTATSPQPVRVVVRGPAAKVPVVAAVAAGDPLCLDEAGAAGSAQTYVAASVGHIFGYALAATGGAGTTTVYVLGCGI